MAGTETDGALSAGHFIRVCDQYLFDGTFSQDRTHGQLAEAGGQTDDIKALRIRNPELVDAGFYTTVKETGNVIVFGGSSELWVPTCDAARDITVKDIAQHIAGAVVATKHASFPIYAPR